jgi:outer membrane protein assembly factor BamA
MAQTEPAQEPPPKKPKPAKTDAKKDYWKPHFVVLPDFYYRPETRLALGIGGFANYRLGNDKEKTRPSTLGLTFVYTMNNQMRVSLRPEIYLPGNKYILNAIVNYSIFPTVFYGIGNNIPASQAETYTPKTFSFQLAVRRKFFGNLFAGIEYQFRNTIIKTVEAGGLLGSGTIPGSQGGTLSGLGLSLSWDTRDNIIFPRRGNYFLLRSDFFGKYLGSSFNYSAVYLDLRTYVPVFETHVLAFQVLMRSVTGNAPFYGLCNLGGAGMMRGTPSGRWCDYSLLATQAEYRIHVWKRISVAGFAGLGDVAPNLTSFTFDPLKYSLGGGLRYCIDSREGTNLRLDYAWGRGSTGLYIMIQEAF